MSCQVAVSVMDVHVIIAVNPILAGQEEQFVVPEQLVIIVAGGTAGGGVNSLLLVIDSNEFDYSDRGFWKVVGLITLFISLDQ